MTIQLRKCSCCSLLWLACVAAGVSPALGQGYSYSPGYSPGPPVVPNVTVQGPTYSAEQLDQMLGPIALYPDPLLSQVLAASTYPQDIAAAGEWVRFNSNRSDDEINGQPWDASVKALVHFPDVLEMMAGQMDWTQALGSAFAHQPNEVMDAVQRLRSRAESARVLATNPQQNVVQDNGVIQILPAQPDTIYVPQYDPGLVYSGTGVIGPIITYSPGFPFGSFFDLNLDYRNHRFLRGRYLDRDRRFDFDHGQPWRHDPGRPIPAPINRFTPPRPPDVRRGWPDGGDRRTPGAFHPPEGAGRPGQGPRIQERPVTGLPQTPGRVGPEPGRVEPRRETPGQRSPAIQTPFHPEPRPAQPQPVTPRVQERPVTGLPPRGTGVQPGPTVRPTPGPTPIQPAPTVRPSPAPRPIQPAPTVRPSPAPTPIQPGPTMGGARPAPGAGPSGAFHPSPGGAGAAARGHGSMGR